MMQQVSLPSDHHNRIQFLRQKLKHYKPRKINPDLERDLQHRWMLPYLLTIDAYTWERWDYWYRLMEAGKLLDEPIPQIEFDCEGKNAEGFGFGTMKHLEKCLNLIPNHGGWQGWEGWQYFDYLLDWLLFGFGHPGQPELPQEPHYAKGASMRLYQTFELHWLLLYPWDYWGAILAENQHGRHLGFFPTPHNVVPVMVLMLLGELEKDQKDHRAETVCDPCLGTGRMLLHASNYSLRLYGQDINPTVIKASLVNGYLYAPWMVKSLPFLDQPLHELGAITSDGQTVASHSSDQLAEQAQSQTAAAEYLAETKHDVEEQWQFEPILKRRKKAKAEVIAEQGLLF